MGDFMAGFKTRTGVGYSLPTVLSENIHYFTTTVEVPQQCNKFKTWPKLDGADGAENILHCCGTCTVLVKE
jgi:hypothetical protein